MAANTGNTSALFPAGTSFGDVGGNPNHVRIELTVTEAGSTTNMSYLAEVDPSFIGTFYSLSGTVTFANNTIALTFGANNDAQIFYDNSGFFAAAQPTPTNALGTVGSPITLTGNFEGSPDIPLAIQWFKNGNSIQDATNLVYTTPPLTIEDAGAQFTYVLTNLNTSATATSPETTVTLPSRTTPGIEVIDFSDTIVTDGNTAAPSPPVDISGAEMLAGDTWIFDAIIETNAPLTGSGDGWAAVEFAPGGYIGITGADLGVLVRIGIGAGQLFINGGGGPTTTPSGAVLNRLRVELFPSASSTTNMGYLVQIDQNNSGTLRTVGSGTNLTFPNNNIPLGFGADAVGYLITEDTESVSVFTGPTPASQTVGVGTPVTVSVVVKGWYPAFQWLKNGNPILNATNRSYTLASPTLADDGDQFSVVVSNTVNPANVVTSGVATVNIRTPNDLTWDPAVDATTWDTTTLNWTNISGGPRTNFTSGDNATLDSLGYNIGGNLVTATNAVNANAVTVNATGSETYQWTGSGSYNGQYLHLTGDGTGTLQSEAGVSFAIAAIDAGSTLQVGNGTANGSFNANVITNNGTIDFENTSGILTVSGSLTGSGSIYQLGSGQTTLSATNSVYSIGLISAGNLAIASAPVGNFENDAVLQPNGPANLLLTNSISGSGYIYFSGFQATTLTGSNTFTGQNQLFWSVVTVDNPWALGDTDIGSTVVSGGGRAGTLYLSNNITWVQSLILGGQSGASATAPLLGNASGSNTVVGPLVFSSTEPGVSGTEFNIDSSAGILTVDSAVANNTTTNSDLNLQGTTTGIWNGDLTDNGEDFLNVVKRGTGVWTLAGTNSYGGSNTVAGGTLLVTGQLNGAATVLVESGGTLGGNGGTIAGPVTVAAGGTLAPGGNRFWNHDH
jgi:autotransporter-associated beta strand protein